MNDHSANLIGFDRSALISYFDDLGEKSYRADQLMKWLYHHHLSDVGEMTNFSKRLRQHLATNTEIRLPEVDTVEESADGTVKWVLKTENGDSVETVLIPERQRNTLCISSQVGCMLDCSFCATGKQGFNGNLSIADMVGQVLFVVRWLEGQQNGHKLTNVVFMGMGEPLLNFEATMAATDIFMDDMAFGLSKRRVTVSTAGVVPAIMKMCGRTEASLAVSLHATHDALRNELVPINRKYPIAVLMKACRDYLASLDGRRIITFEYILIEGVNDSPRHARELFDLVQPIRNKINIIPYNPIQDSNFKRPSEARIAAFQKVLMDRGQIATRRTTRGSDINAACGQLVGVVRDRTRRKIRLESQRQNVSSVSLLDLG